QPAVRKFYKFEGPKAQKMKEAIAEITLMNLLTRGQEKTPDIPDWRNIEYPKDYIGPKLEDYQDTENNDTNERNDQHMILNQQSGSSTANGDPETKVNDKFILVLLEYIQSKRNQYHGLFGNPALVFKLGEYIVPHRLILQLIDKAQQILAQEPTLLVVQHPHAKFKEKIEKMKEIERKKEAELEKLQKQEEKLLKAREIVKLKEQQKLEAIKRKKEKSHKKNKKLLIRWQKQLDSKIKKKLKKMK
ncbi:MAG: hypothetical protein EZS28_046626, partial [Streblomastix strix]